MVCLLLVLEYVHHEHIQRIDNDKIVVVNHKKGSCGYYS